MWLLPVLISVFPPPKQQHGLVPRYYLAGVRNVGLTSSLPRLQIVEKNALTAPMGGGPSFRFY